MRIDRLPRSRTEKPYLYAAYNHDKKEVMWALERDELWKSEDFQDGTNWMLVWRGERDVIHVAATQWHSSDGSFEMQLNFVTPDGAVYLAEKAAFLANDLIDGGIPVSEMP